MFSRLIASSLLAICLATVAAAQDRGTAEVTIKGKKISIDYGRPALEGRDVLSMARVGDVWRLGKNKATEIETTGDIVVDGKVLKAGRYSLWAKKTGDASWVLAFHPKTGVWGAPALTEGYVAQLPLRLTRVAQNADVLTIGLSDQKGKAGIKIHWGGAVLTGSFGVQ